MKYSAYVKQSQEVFEHDNLKELYHIVIAYGMELIRQYGQVSTIADRIVIENNETSEEICSIHFGQLPSERGTVFSSVRVRAYHGKNNINCLRWNKVRIYDIDK